MELCEKEEYRGCTINVYYDETPEDPRTWDNVATFVCEHRRYNLGDEQDIERAKICKSVVGAYVQIGFSNLNDEILNDMVEQINKKVA